MTQKYFSWAPEKKNQGPAICIPQTQIKTTLTLVRYQPIFKIKSISESLLEKELKRTFNNTFQNASLATWKLKEAMNANTTVSK